MGTDNVSEDEGRGGGGAGGENKPASTGRTLVEYAVLAVVAVAVALLIQAFLVKPYRIPSESMENTLLIGDRVLVDRISWRFTEPQRGEITVFHPPFSGPVLIKRIIGMPGDVISLRDGYVYINGVRLNEPYVRRIGGRQEPTDPFTNGLAWSLQQPYHVPAGTYFMMGDNRTDSGDSRQFGPMPKADIIGEAFLIYWPLNRLRIL
jgi:signal peptidase I